MKILFSLLAYVLFFSHAVHAHFFWDYERVYSTFDDSVSTYIFFGVSEWLGYDEKTGHSYLKLQNPTQIWFGNKEIEWLDYIHYNGIQRPPYIFQSSKRDFWGRTLFIEYSCDTNDFHKSEECDEENWIQAIKESQWKKIAIWMTSFQTQIVDDSIPT